MTDSQKKKCHAIIHSHALICGAGNLSPVPGTGLFFDFTTMTTMVMALATVFKGAVGARDIPKKVAEGMAIVALKQTILQQPLKTGVKEVAKVIPIWGQGLSAAISIAMIESAGWIIAYDLENKSEELPPNHYEY
jgi:uncharacterized protein (DUF697 family)